ncbi:hypothetical protein C8A01DRAFT_41875, partial [Parachaetomium inaequale]
MVSAFPSERDSPAVRSLDFKRLQGAVEELHGGVYKARLLADDTLYVYKQVERPFYVAGNSDVLQQELRNLELFRGSNVGIVQL